MANDQIRNEDLFAGDLFKSVTKDAEGFLVVLNKIEQGFKEVAIEKQKALNSEDNKTIQSVQRTKKAIDDLNQTERVASKLAAEKIRLNDRLVAARSKQGLQNQEVNQLIREQVRLNKQLINENAKIVGSYSALSNRLKRLTLDYKNVAASEGTTSVNAIKLRNEIQKLDTQMNQINGSTGKADRSLRNFSSNIGRSALGFLGLASGVALVGNAISGAAETIRDFDESVADLQKVTGLAKDDARDLAKEVLKIDTRTSVSALLELATAGGRLNLQGRELLAFTESVDKAFVSLGDSLPGTAEEIGLSLGKIASNFNLETEFGIGKAIDKVGSSLNDLGAKSKANEGDILDFTNRLAGVGSQAGLTVPEVQSLGALFSETGQSIEVAASTFNTLLPAIGKDTKKFAKLVGKDIKEFEDLVANKPLEALKLVAKSAQSSEKGLKGLSQTLENYGIDSARASGIVGILSSKTERLTELQEISNDAFEKGTSLADEFAIKNETLAAKTDRLSNTYDKLILNIESGNGVLSKFFSQAVTELDNMLKGIDRVSVALTELQKIGGREELLSGIAEAFGPRGIVNPLDNIAAQVDLKTTEIADNYVKKNKDAQLKILQEVQKRINADVQLSKTATGFDLLNVERRLKSNLLLLSKLKTINTVTKENTEETIANTDAKGKNAKVTDELNGLIEKQAKVVSDVNEQIQKATTEEQILEFSIKLDIETDELERLRRIVSSSLEEIDKIERDLIEDQTERRIAQEIEKSEKLIAQIESNSRIEESKKKELIEAENRRLALFVNEEELKAGQQRIKDAEALSKAEFEQRRTGFKTEEEFEKEKAEQFKAIRKNAIKEEIALIEQFGGEGSELRVQQLKAELEGLNDIGNGFKDLQDIIGGALEVIADLVDEAFEKRIEAIGEAINKTGERIDQLRDKANEGQLASQESLAFEQKKEAELEKQRRREQKRQERTQAFFTVLQTFQANVSRGSVTPLQDTIRDVGVLKALASSFGSAFDGVDDTGGRGTLDSKGGKPWILHPKEQVLSLKDRTEIKDPKTGKLRNRSELKDIVKRYDSGMLQDLMAHDVSNDFMNPSAFVLNGMDTTAIVKKLDSVEKAVKSIQPITGSVDINEAKKVINYTYRKGNNIVKEKSKLFG